METDKAIKMDIIRSYPVRQENIPYPTRFDRYRLRQTLDPKFQADYFKWKSGINPETNRKIGIYGEVHKRLRNIYDVIDAVKTQHINIEQYILCTESLNREVDKLNSDILRRNQRIDDLVREIKLLKHWEDFIVFEGQKYGVPCILDKVHRQDNCMGCMVKSRYESCSCSTCENWHGCGRGGTQYYVCDTCNFETCIIYE
jgi:hypothetical protein